jgi:hypothetical protein
MMTSVEKEADEYTGRYCGTTEHPLIRGYADSRWDARYHSSGRPAGFLRQKPATWQLIVVKGNQRAETVRVNAVGDGKREGPGRGFGKQRVVGQSAGAGAGDDFCIARAE